MVKLFKILSFALVSVFFTQASQAVTIATYTPGSYLQNGTVTNNYAQTLVGVMIDFVPDAGGNTPIWDTNAGFYVGTPVGTLTNVVQGVADSFFTISWMGLNITTGNSFNYTGLDLDGWDNPGTNGGGSTALDGSEYVKLFYADGSSVIENLMAGPGSSAQAISFDSANLVREGVLPEPAPLALLGLGLLGLGVARKRRG